MIKIVNVWFEYNNFRNAAVMANDAHGKVRTNNIRDAPLRSKIFTERKSLFAELSEISHFVTIKSLFYATLFGFIGYDIVRGLIFGENVHYGLRLIRIGFAKFELIILLWTALFFVNILVFYCFIIWAKTRVKLTPKSLITKLWDLVCLLGFLTYCCGLIGLTPVWILKFETGVVSNAVILAEQVRILMKVYAFVRSNTPNVLNYKPHTEKDLSLPTLSSYVYYFFAPTIIFRLTYPRTKQINYSFALQCFIEVVAVIWLQSFVMDLFFVRNFEEMEIRGFTWTEVFSLIMRNVIGAFIIFTSVFYQLLDRWMNGWAEILRFADRQFYEDWWTCTNYSVYLRKWNIVVQDWLYEYVYKEFYENLAPKNRRLAKFMVFLVSAIFHEYVLIFMIDAFFPLLFFNFFVLGQFLSNYYIKSEHPFFNMGMLYSLSLGNSIQLSLYTMEVQARKYCFDNSTWSYFKPRILNPNCVE